jgi:hypothetical protein
MSRTNRQLLNAAFSAALAAAPNSVAARFDSLPSITDYWHLGLDPTGVGDSTAAINYFLGTVKKWARVPNGRYRVTAELVPGDGGGLVGDLRQHFWQYLVNAPALGTVPEIYYDGVGGANSAVLRWSKEPVGTLPTSQPDESQTLHGTGLIGLVINGNGKADFGLYSARAGLGNTYGWLIVTGTNKRGFWFGEMWLDRVGPLFAIHNNGTGGAIGEDLFGWSTQNVVNEVHFDGLFAFKNGRSATYNDVTAPTDGVGWIINCNRTCKITLLHGEMNYGAGAYVSPRAGPNVIECAYFEDNCHFDPAVDDSSTTNSAYALGKCTQPWGMVGYNRHASGDTIQVLFRGIFGAAPGSAPVRYQYIKLTGDKTGGFVQEPDEAWVLSGIFGIKGIDSDFYNYRLEDCQSTLQTSGLLRCLPNNGQPETIVGNVATLYAGNAASGDKSGSSAANLMLLTDALNCARVVKSVTTIDVSHMTATSATGVTIDGHGYSRRLTIDGGAAGRFNASAGTAAIVQRWKSKLTIQNMAVMDRTYFYDADAVLNNCPILRMGSDATAGAALVLDRSNVEVTGTSVVDVSASTAATKIGARLQGNSQLSFNNAGANTVKSFTAGHAIEFGEGSGILRVSITTATATWAAAASVFRDTDGGAGMVMAPNGLNP